MLATNCQNRGKMAVISCTLLLKQALKTEFEALPPFSYLCTWFHVYNMLAKPPILRGLQGGQPWDATEQLRETSQSRKRFLSASFLCFVVSSFSLEMCI